MQDATSQFLKKMAKRNHPCLQEHTSIATDKWNWTMCVCAISFQCTKLEKKSKKKNNGKKNIGARKTPAVPLVSFLDFPDSHKFGGLSILSDVSDLDDTDPRLLSMEKFAKTALTLFHPFRKAHEHLTLDGKHLPKFQTLFASGDLDKHKHCFVKAQESHNSFSCGRPDNVLESNTHFPKCVLDSNLSDFDAETRESDEMCVESMHIIHKNKMKFHDEKDKLKVQSSIITDAGSHKC